MIGGVLFTSDLSVDHGRKLRHPRGLHYNFKSLSITKVMMATTARRQTQRVEQLHNIQRALMAGTERIYSKNEPSKIRIT
jgi:hypothetical protein